VPVSEGGAGWARIAATRILQLVFGLVVLYFSLPMFSSAGLQDPNVGVWLGLIGIGLLTASASRAEGHLFAGLWVSVMAFALPVILFRFRVSAILRARPAIRRSRTPTTAPFRATLRCSRSRSH